MQDFSLILLCAGSSQRSKLNINKTLFSINEKPVFSYSLESFIKAGIKNFIIAVKKDEKEFFEEYTQNYKDVNIQFVIGGKTRQESVKNSIELVETKYVLIHDAARIYIHEEDIKNLINKTKEKHACSLAKNCQDTISIIDKDNFCFDYIDRSKVALIQTPQSFLTSELYKIYKSEIDISKYTDDTSLYQAFYNKKVYIVFSKHINEKLTYKKDFENLKEINYGVGFDMHKLVENRDLILGGIKIPHNKGLLGHSDADVLTHAIMDALLSSCNLKDIGHYFPDTDPKYKDANSIKLLDEVMLLINKKGFSVNNVSCEIMCEKPKLAKYLDEIESNLAKHLKITNDKIKISATTLEGLGFIGREEGIGTHCVLSVIKYPEFND